MNNYLREPVNGFTHLAGAILSFIGLLALVIKTALQVHSTIALTAVIIFGISMIVLYAKKKKKKRVLPKFPAC